MKKVLKGLKWTILSLIFLVFLILVPLGLNKLYEKIQASFLTENEKRLEDIDRLEYIFKNEFSGYNVLPGRQSFDEQIEALRQAAAKEPLQSQEEFNIAVIKTVASFRDPHTNIMNKTSLVGPRFPFSLTWSEGNFYLMGGQVDPRTLGARVVRIGNMDSQEVFKKLSSYCNSPNEAGAAYFIGSIISSSEVLYHEGIIPDKNEVELEILQDGRLSTLTFQPLSENEIAGLTDYVRMNDKWDTDEIPLYQRNPEKNYWYTTIEDDNIFYLRYSACIAQGDIEAFWNEVFEKIHNTRPEKVVIDVRGNGGGDTQNHNSFLNRIAADTLINQYGKLYTLIDRGTGSAAVSFASDMERMTHTILVGEKTMDTPNTTSDPTFFTLPHAKIKMIVPSLYSLHSHLNDHRDAVIPDIPIPQNLEGEAYLHDEVLDSIGHIHLTDNAIYASLPENAGGNYIFSELRNLTIHPRDSVWYVTIDGLTEAPLFQNDTAYYTLRYGIRLEMLDSLGKELILHLHGSSLKLTGSGDALSIEKLISEGKYEEAEKNIRQLETEGRLPYYLERPYFQSRVYTTYNQQGFDNAYALNQLAKSFYPDDPVVYIVDFELYQYEGQSLKQFTSFFPVIGKLLKRYYRVITTDKVMNDEYNAFIGR
ncbi:S41 family peptidase [Fulvivirga sedimenti]|uniref:Tail specific protease domain-containing protein n=1 Tax=Fulvivirga sedimenti TaxID=2879465 RepID=A0A9X1HPY5_9BACT|nr:S41 family peptidase [Fulvivirga sedimenti]MCA6075055.1 hypothetical protein [Fulvivirga sedimenti]MCA6076232.1 hypothetical protein [Fulvivirga sedimenti]MCA6077360.1 hypothetical protein [Fulvivirga sedimenti]